MKTVKIANDLKVSIIEEGSKVTVIEIDNPDWNYVCDVIAVDGKRTVQIDNKTLRSIDESWLRLFIEKTYQDNKAFIVDAKLSAFRAY